VFSGGAFKGCAFLGSIKYLEEHDLLKHIKNVIGSSAGAIIGFLLCMGYKSSDAIAIMYHEMKTYAEKDLDLDAVLSIFETMGIDDCQGVIDGFSNILYKRLKVYDITFLELAKRTGFNFVVCGSNISLATVEYFCVDRTPGMSVLQALRISFSLPVVMTPVIMNGMIYVDASLFNNFPIEYFMGVDRPFKDTISLEITCPDKLPDVTNINMLSYIKIMMDAMFKRMNRKICREALEKQTKNNAIIQIVMDDDSYGIDLATFKLKMSKQIMDEYVKKGYDAMDAHFATVLSETNLLSP
jgi:predicted acylesterase/phospholipase RssA